MKKLSKYSNEDNCYVLGNCSQSKRRVVIASGISLLKAFDLCADYYYKDRYKYMVVHYLHPFVFL